MLLGIAEQLYEYISSEQIFLRTMVVALPQGIGMLLGIAEQLWSARVSL